MVSVYDAAVADGLQDGRGEAHKLFAWRVERIRLQPHVGEAEIVPLLRADESGVTVTGSLSTSLVAEFPFTMAMPEHSPRSEK